MAKLTIHCGATVEKDITGKNALREIKSINPEGFDVNDLTIHVGRKIIDPMKLDLNHYLNRVFDEDISIIAAPKGFDPVTAAIIIVASVAASFVFAPDIPDASYQDAVKQSPNNSFTGQTNTVRLDQLSPNSYGSNTSYPDILNGEGGAWEYVSDRKIISEVFLVGTGSYRQDSEARYENTDLNDITGSSYVWYEPFDLIPQVQGQFNSEFIDGQSLPGPNNDEVTDGVTADGSNSPSLSVQAEASDPSVLNVRFIEKDANWDQIYANSENGAIPVRIRFTYSYYALDQTPACVPVQVTREGVVRLSFDPNVNQYTANISNIPIGESDCSDPSEGNYANEISITELLGAVLTVKMPILTNELQVSFDFRNGLRGTANILVVANTETGINPIEMTYTYSANTSSQKFFTEKIDISQIENLDNGLVVAIVRTNDDKDDNTDRVQVSQVATNTYRTNVSYGNKTILTTSRKATEQAVRFAQSKINIDITRKTISYDPNTGQVINTLNPTRSFADAMLHEYVEIQGLNPKDLPLDDMYEIAGRIGSLGNFDYTFDNKDSPIKSRLSVIANAARCIISYTGSGYEIFRDEKRTPSAQFDARNISSESPEEYSWLNADEASNDGVKLKWTNPEVNSSEYIYYVIESGQSIKCISQGGGVYIPSLPKVPLDIELTGCKTESQGDNRANMECRKLIYLQKSLKITTLRDGENVTRGETVKHCDYYEDNLYSGEISNINGNIFTTFSDIKVPVGSYVVTYTDINGSLIGPVDCEVISSNKFVATMPEAYTADGVSTQLGTRVIISTSELHSVNLYTVNSKTSNSDGTVDLELAQYDERIYPELDGA